MTEYCVGCDNIVGGETDIISKVASVLEKEGNTCEKLNVGPNYTQSKGLQGSSKGKVAVFIVGGSDIGTYVDFRDGIKNGYYHYKFIWFAFASWTASTWITCEELKTRGLVRAHDDNFSSSGSIAPYIGKSADYFFSQNKDVMGYVCGQSPEELAKKILGGGTSSDDEGSAASSTIKDALKKAVSGWDGDVEIRLIEDTVYVNKIPDPTTAELVISEYDNVQYDSVSVTDIHPQAINKLTVSYQGEDLTISDDLLIERFGEIPYVLEVPQDETIQNYEDVVSYLHRSWNRIRRDAGRQVELKVDGDSKWKTGLWARVFLPRFYIDDYMYISRMSAEEDGSNNWTTSLTLVDYPPSFGAEVEEPEETEEEEEETEEDTEATEEET